MTLRHAALSSLFIIVTTACSSGLSETGNGRGGTGGTNSSGGTGGSGKGGSAAGGSGGSNTGGSGGSSTGGSGGSNTGGSGGSTGGTGGVGTGGAAGTGGAGTGGIAGAGGSTSGGAGGAGAGGTGMGGTAGAAGSGTGGGTTDAGGKGGAAGSAGAGGAAGTAGSKDAGTGGTADSSLPPPPPPDGGPPGIPPPVGACPNFVQGNATFNPAGGARTVTIHISAANQTTRGPIIFYWHATGSQPTEASRGLPLPTVLAAGGVVIAPSDVPNAGTFPWLSNFNLHDALVDEVLGCAQQKANIDTNRIHAVGFSAGGLMTTHLSYARSRYMASVATYSGGANGQFQDPNNKFAAMIMTGGMGNDTVVTDFYASSVAWQSTLKGAGHFAMLCDHGGGHNIPMALVPGVWQFFLDHPFGRNPSPYAGGKIPSAISVCKE
jgi:predicted esterase